jgi:hypothetical protein
MIDLISSIGKLMSQGIGYYAGLAVTFALIVLLVVKLLADSHGSARTKRLSRRLTVPVWVIFFVFLLVLASRLSAYLF